MSLTCRRPCGYFRPARTARFCRVHDGPGQTQLCRGPARHSGRTSCSGRAMSRVERALLRITILAIPAAIGLGLSLWFTPDEKNALGGLYYTWATAFALLGAVGTLTLVWVFLWEGTR